MTFGTALKLMKYLLFSRHGKGHGIHSPFVFRVVKDVFRNKTVTQVVLTIEQIRKKNRSDSRTIDVLDLGAGSSKMKSNRRKVSDIAKYSPVPRKYGILLASMAGEFGPPAILELGTSLGISTLYLASGCPDSVVYTMEGCPQTSKIALENFSLSGFENIKLLTGSFDESLDIIRGTITPGLVFIDGDHRKESLLKYFNALTEISTPETVIMIDDIHSSQEMGEAWQIIKDHKKVSITIDIFRIGMVFFREGMSHTNYIIRY
ncbi:MAG TPA: class I SAM-dependent methyltransferase [Bacteroidales bacterium]|nr:class I SAM-dependent methyltransferase [Bacteroidales bacterium]